MGREAIDWIKLKTRKDEEGTTVIYQAVGAESLTVESRKRHIPHANGVGTWDHTTYWVLIDGREIKEYYSLKDAKEYAFDHYRAHIMSRFSNDSEKNYRKEKE